MTIINPHLSLFYDFFFFLSLYDGDLCVFTADNMLVLLSLRNWDLGDRYSNVDCFMGEVFVMVSVSGFTGRN